MTFSFSRWLVVFLCGFILSAEAAVVPHLYDIVLTAEKKSDNERQQLLKQGLLQILERVSGETNLEQVPQIKQALGNASDFVEQYSYIDNNLSVKYSADLVNQLIHQSGHTVWGPRRPTVVVWVAVEEQQQPRLVGAETDPTIQAFLMKISQLKGLPLILPLMDLQDVSAITIKDVIDVFPNTLQKASERYGAQAILVGKLVQRDLSGKTWKGEWQLLTEGENAVWQVEGQTLEEILSQGITGTTHHLIGRQSIKANAPMIQSRNQSLFINIEDIHTAAEFSKVENYLRNLNDVVDVNIYQIFGERAVFEVTSQAANGRQVLAQAISHDHYLVPIEVAEAADLTYRWIPQAEEITAVEPVENQPVENLSDED